MPLFQTDTGQIHVGRVALVGYIILVLLCLDTHAAGTLGGTFVTFAWGGRLPSAESAPLASGVNIRPASACDTESS
jgi:hypothetical protein